MAGELVEIKVDDVKLRQVERMLRGFPKAMPKVIARAINRTASSAKTEIGRRIAKEIGMKVADAKKSVILKKASWKRWMASLGISGRRIPLIRFRARQTKKGVSYKIGAKRKFIKTAFIATMVGGNRDISNADRLVSLGGEAPKTAAGVYKRVGIKRLPIVERFGPSMGIVFEESGSIAKDVTESAYKMLGRNIDDQVALVLKRMKGAAA